MRRRTFLKLAGSAMVVRSSWMEAQTSDGRVDLRDCAVLVSKAATTRELRAAQVLVEEAAKRCGITWPSGNSRNGGTRTTIVLATRASAAKLSRRFPVSEEALRDLRPDGFLLQTGSDGGGSWVAVFGADERGLLFGVGKLLRLIDFSRQAAELPGVPLQMSSSPQYKLRGHQLGYRPKTNAYDAWTVEIWDQYIRDLAIFGTNAIELMPPRSDDLPDSPHFPLPPAEMMVKMSQIADNYGLDVWVWYPAMDPDYSNPQTVDSAVQEWARVLHDLPRLDAVFVPGGDPGHTEPKYLLGLLEKQKQSLTQAHPKMQMWVSPQGFSADWMTEFMGIIREPHTQRWLDGVVFGPQSRLSLEEFRRAVPERYPVRFYPDITHSVGCQYPVPDWDVAYAMTEGREVINPRPVDEANILRQSLPETIGFITYSEGCNDDVNKFVWSALGWDSKQPISAMLRDFSHYFIGKEQEDGFAQGLLNLEQNWRGPLATNELVDVTMQAFRDMENTTAPEVLENWRWQQALYRTYYDAYVRRRLLLETGQLNRALDVLDRVNQLGWSALPLGIGQKPSEYPANHVDPSIVIDAAITMLEEPGRDPAGLALRARITELGYALFQSIRMQLAVERYQGEAVERAANLDTLDTPVTDGPWLRRQLLKVKAMNDPDQQVTAVRQLLTRTDPGPGGFYDQLGNVVNRPHLVPGEGWAQDPEFRHTPQIGFDYPDKWGGEIPYAWKSWAESLYDAAIEMQYEGLDPHRDYRVRVVYSGNSPRFKIRLAANDSVEIHPYIPRAWPPAPQEFAIPRTATALGKLRLSWTREPGLGGNGIGCQVAEVYLFPTATMEPSS
ncbi:MAG TPA: hypothetical protein VHZ09_12745 [Acidobacteriaceae bacterium]|jgi:hypothetical protein|nr:hypothetical protein [Acidobacteriaceae bacterium]